MGNKSICISNSKFKEIFEFRVEKDQAYLEAYLLLNSEDQVIKAFNMRQCARALMTNEIRIPLQIKETLICLQS